VQCIGAVEARLVQLGDSVGQQGQSLAQHTRDIAAIRSSNGRRIHAIEDRLVRLDPELEELLERVENSARRHFVLQDAVYGLQSEVIGLGQKRVPVTARNEGRRKGLAAQLISWAALSFLIYLLLPLVPFVDWFHNLKGAARVTLSLGLGLFVRYNLTSFIRSRRAFKPRGTDDDQQSGASATSVSPALQATAVLQASPPVPGMTPPQVVTYGRQKRQRQHGDRLSGLFTGLLERGKVWAAKVIDGVEVDQRPLQPSAVPSLQVVPPAGNPPNVAPVATQQAGPPAPPTFGPLNP
jgi:hypothetical protein